MKNNKCQAFTKKKKSCQNYAMNGSQLCNFHKELFKDFPPVKITALICSYCDEPLEREAKFCKTCRNHLLLCPYCDEPLRKDSEFCSFCKEDITPVITKPLILKPFKPNVYGRLIDVIKRGAAKAMDISIDWISVAIFLLITLFCTVFIVNLYFQIINP